MTYCPYAVPGPGSLAEGAAFARKAMGLSETAVAELAAAAGQLAERARRQDERESADARPSAADAEVRGRGSQEGAF